MFINFINQCIIYFALEILNGFCYTVTIDFLIDNEYNFQLKVNYIDLWPY